MTLLAAPGADLPRAALDLLAELHALPAPPVEPPADPEWRVPPVPAELLGRRVELVVPAHDGQELRAAHAARPDALVLDFDDTFSPTWANVLAGHANARAHVNHAGILMLRPRGLHLLEGHVWVDGRPANAGLFDLAVALQALAPRARAGRLIYLYLPKVETPEHAGRWNAAIGHAERALSLPPGCVRVGIQIESFGAATCADALTYELRGRVFALNAGRWDYFCSLIRTHPDRVLPDRARMHMGEGYLSGYARLIVRAASRRGAQAVGGTAAMVPNTADPTPVLERVRADKQLEANLGYVAAWAGHADLVPVVREVFENAGSGDAGPPVTAADLAAVPDPGPLSVDAVRDTIALAAAYLAGWVRGEGVLVRGGRVEDLATVEFARAQLWQWVRHAWPLQDGTRLTRERYLKLSADTAHGEGRELLDALVTAPEFPDYFARVLYPALLRHELTNHGHTNHGHTTHELTTREHT